MTTWYPRPRHVGMTAFIAVLVSQVLVFDLIMANAKPFRPTSWRKPPRTYMPGLSVNLEGIVTNMNNRLDIYDACRKELRFPDWTPLKNEWDCERLLLPNKMMLWSLRFVKDELLYKLKMPKRDIDAENQTANVTMSSTKKDYNLTHGFIEEELAIQHNMYELVQTIADLRRRQSYSIHDEMYSWVRDIRNLWGHCCRRLCDDEWNRCISEEPAPVVPWPNIRFGRVMSVDRSSALPHRRKPLHELPKQRWSYITYQRLKYEGVYRRSDLAIVSRLARVVARELDDLVTAFRAQPPVWKTLPVTTSSSCPSPETRLIKERRATSLLTQTCHVHDEIQERFCDGEGSTDSWSAALSDDYLCHGAGGPVVFCPVTPTVEVVWGHIYEHDLDCMSSDIIHAAERRSLLASHTKKTDPTLGITAS